jgi:hypothetical protein
MYATEAGIESDFLCRLRTFCAGLLFVQILCKAGATGLAQKVGVLSLSETALCYFLSN